MSEQLERPTIDTAEIIAVGTELLLGQTINTNATDLALYLSALGISVYHMTVVGDNPGRMKDAILQAVNRADLVILTGGLGPTDDDISMQVVADTLGLSLQFSETAWRQIEQHFERFGRKATDNNRKQAMLPIDHTVLVNPEGTAPGALIKTTQDGRAVYLALLPGPPREMRAMFERELEPWLEAHSDTKFIHRFVRLVGIGESAAAEKLQDLTDQQTNPTLATYASTGETYVRVTQRLDRNGNGEDLTEALIEKIKERLGSYIYEIGNRDLPKVVQDILSEKNMTVSLAESITGGRVAAEMTKHPGSADVFLGGVVCYTNESKRRDLGVSKDDLAKHGAVSWQVAKQMADGAKARFGSDFAVSITGLAGPGKGDEDEKIGTCYIGVATPDGTEVFEYKTGGGRRTITRRAVLQALMRLWEVIR
ncbi:MAG TPA: competence/damage-inducible protein A [Fastidiosipila sp.]|nr:competence/damage-inducible protein A [Fastidiosipila sp.]